MIPADADGPAERAERHEAIARSREALPALKPQELRALTLLAEGYSYREIGEITGFSPTKINRCLAEGRERFRRFLARSDGGGRCAELRPLLSAFCDGEAGAEDAATVREHLRACAHCRATLRAYRAAPGAAAALAPALPAGAAAARAGSRRGRGPRRPVRRRRRRLRLDPRPGRRRRRRARRRRGGARQGARRSASAPSAAPRPAWPPASSRPRSASSEDQATTAQARAAGAGPPPEPAANERSRPSNRSRPKPRRRSPQPSRRTGSPSPNRSDAAEPPPAPRKRSRGGRIHAAARARSPGQRRRASAVLGLRRGAPPGSSGREPRRGVGPASAAGCSRCSPACCWLRPDGAAAVPAVDSKSPASRLVEGDAAGTPESRFTVAWTSHPGRRHRCGVGDRVPARSDRSGDGTVRGERPRRSLRRPRADPRRPARRAAGARRLPARSSGCEARPGCRRPASRDPPLRRRAAPARPLVAVRLDREPAARVELRDRAPGPAAAALRDPRLRGRARPRLGRRSPARARSAAAEEIDLGGGEDDDSIVLGPLAEGDQLVRVVAVSGSGVHSAAAGAARIRVDGTPPAIATRRRARPAGRTARWR